MNIFYQLKQDIESNLQEFAKNLGNEINSHFSIELTKDSTHGDIATNAAMINSRNLKSSPKEIAIFIQSKLENAAYIKKIEIAGPGFINFFIQPKFLLQTINDIRELKLDYGTSKLGKNEEINLEFLSTNPTGPLHIGHCRIAIYGDALASLLEKIGFNVVREYYINDAGVQIDNLTKSAFCRYTEFFGQNIGDQLEGLYPGEYLIDFAEKLKNQFGSKLLEMGYEEALRIIKPLAVDAMMDLIREDLKLLGIEHKVFFSEKTLHDEGKINKIINKLIEKNIVYQGVIEKPKGKTLDNWEEREQLLFAAKSFGDSDDRALTKFDGSWTYFAADIAYMEDKIARGFKKLYLVLGSDHIGYQKRIEAIFKSLTSNSKDYELQIKFCQLVYLLKNGEPFKMSKRKGNLVYVKDVLEQVDKDILRFVMLTRKNDMEIDFDFERVKEQSKDNPVFYVQYASARCNSIINKAKEELPEAYNMFNNNQYNVDFLQSAEEIELARYMAYWPRYIESAALACEPHRIIFYLSEISAKLHALWHKGNEDKEFRFILTDNVELTAARLALVESVASIIKNGLKILNIEALSKM